MIRIANDTILQVQLGGPVATNEIPVFASYEDIYKGYPQSNLGGSAQIDTTGTTIADLVTTSPMLVDGGVNKTGVRFVDSINITNTDSAAVSVSLFVTNSEGAKLLITVTLEVGDLLQYTDEDGWRVLDATGAIKNVYTGTGSGTVTSVGTAGMLGGGTITTAGVVTTSSPTNKLIGRYTAGTGVFEPVTLGAGLSFTGSTLNVSAIGGGANAALSNLVAVAINAALVLGTSDAFALGSATKMWSDLFLAAGAEIIFDAGNAVITHSTGVITISTGDLRVTTAGTNAASAVTNAGTQTLTNKRRTRRLTTTNAPGATPTTNTDNVDIMNFTGLNTAITSMTTSLSGTPVDGDLLEFRFTDDGTPRVIAWGASFASTTITLPTTTVTSAMLRVGFEFSGSTWNCIAVA